MGVLRVRSGREGDLLVRALEGDVKPCEESVDIYKIVSENRSQSGGKLAIVSCCL